MTKILLIEDEPIERELAHSILQKQGYEVIKAVDGGNALTIVQQQKIDIIITDILMPDVDGIELIMAIRNSHRTLPIIAVSGGGTIDAENYLTMAQELGANASISKPIDWDHLFELIDKLVGTE